ncbi:MAG: alkaline phosphatase family protein [Alphaproteobacteria bacterium]|nr:alkaline phosphatase family protein [Alphaproteobacteria bacterium]
MNRPNLLFITADQWRGACLGALGHPVVRTPNLDRLARMGTLFARHYAVTAPCGPSRASLLTGTYLHRHRSCINGTPLDRRFTNIALEARRLGYRPTLFGYTDTSQDPRGLAPGDPRLTSYEEVMPGFDAGLVLTEELKPWVAWLKARGRKLPGDGLRAYMPRDEFPAYWKFGNPHVPAPFDAAESETEFLTMRALDWLDAHGGEPWFLHLSYLRPHPPFVAPEPYHSMYAGADPGPFVRRASKEEEGRLHPFLAWAMTRPGWFAPSDERDQIAFKRIYFGLMTQFDDTLGRLLDRLERNGELERTIIVFTSDHGEMMGDHWLMGKLGFFDQAFHIPLIIAAPGLQGGRQITHFTESVDVMPTILDLLGGEIPLQVQGRSLRPFLAGGMPADWREDAHWEFDFRDPQSLAAEKHFGLDSDSCALAVLRSDRHKYVHFAALEPLLFDLQADPCEERNALLEPAAREIALRMAQRLISWRMRNEERELTGWKLVAPAPIRPATRRE